MANMKTKSGLMWVYLGAFLLAMSAATLAAGPGGGGGGGGATSIPQIAGIWHGQYTYTVFAFGPVPPGTNATNQVIVELNEDGAGNLTGRVCTPGLGGAVPA